MTPLLEHGLEPSDFHPSLVYPSRGDDPDRFLGDKEWNEQLNWLYAHQDAIAELLGVFENSGVTAKFHQGHFGFFPEIDPKTVNPTPSDLEAAYQTYYGDQKSYQQLTDEEVRSLTKLIGREGLGGIGITARTLEDLQKGVPELLQAIEERVAQQPNAKIKFLGNGFARISIDIMKLLNTIFYERLTEEQRNNFEQYYTGSMVIADLFSLKKVLEAMQNFQIHFFLNLGNEWPWVDAPEPFLIWYRRVARLIRWVDREDRATFAPAYRLPQQYDQLSIPSILCNADFIINYMGPPKSTLAVQLAMLNPGGELWFISDDEVVIPPEFNPEDFTIEVISNQAQRNRVTAVRIQRLR